MDGKTYPSVGFVGAGNMAEALISGMRAAGWPADRIWANNRSHRPRLEALHSRPATGSGRPTGRTNCAPPPRCWSWR